MTEPRKEVLIVTGASRGIGAAIACLAGARGFAVAINYLENSDRAVSVKAEIDSAGGQALLVQGDIGRETDVVELFEQSERALGPVTGLVNNAGVTGGFARVENVEARMLERLFAVNIGGSILCAREAIKRMSTNHGGCGGSIVNISSLAARTGGANEWVHYAATKGAINSFTIGLSREVAAEGIRVNAVAPGLIDTELHAANGDPERPFRMQATIPMKRSGTALEIAEGVLWLLSPAAAYITGTILEIGGGR